MTGNQLTHGWVRLARGTILGGSSLVLATAAHLAGGGSLPGGGLLMLAGVALALVAVSVTARRLRFVPLLLVLSVEQVLLHLLFHAAGTAASCASVAMPRHATPLHAMPGHALGSTVCGTGTPGSTGWAMLLAHLAAVAATAWLLARGERWLWRVVDRVHAYATARPTPRRRLRPAAVTVPVAGLVKVGRAAARPRGPPLAAI